ncbi:amidohydrolase [Pseudarthrobacter sp. J1738]|uniref:amidohydrolase n=1 Tax=Pseudarthrobacter sp. J1738 TaxID=3420446 RepID=UPI003D2975F9
MSTPTPARNLTLYRNGSVYSAADPFASAMLVDGDTVAWIGSEQAATSIADSTMHIVDLQGALVTPGFVDSHVHLTETGAALASLNLAEIGSAQELLATIEAGATANGSAVLLGHSWDNSAWRDHTLPTSEQLARAAAGKDFYLTRVDVHSALVSQKLAEQSGATSLPGWDAVHSLVTREAHAAVRPLARKFAPSQLQEFQRAALHEAARNGYVALAEMSSPQIAGMDDFRLATSWTSQATATPSVYGYWGQLVSTEAQARELVEALGSKVRGLAGDLNMDGALGSRTAALRTDYADAAGERGAAYLNVEQAAQHLAACTQAGLQGGFHMIGDAALDTALEALDRVATQLGGGAVRAAAHRFEHVEMADAQAIERLAAHSVTVSAQPSFDATWGSADGMYAQRLGERHVGMNPFASMFRAGVPLAFGSDSPVTALRPWDSIRACLNHNTASERISARAAFIGHTRAGWRALRESNPLLGQLVPGAPASFAVWEVEELMVQVADERVQSWSTDPRARTPLLPALDGDAEPICLQTVANGTEIYSAEQLDSAGNHEASKWL